MTPSARFRDEVAPGETLPMRSLREVLWPLVTVLAAGSPMGVSSQTEPATDPDAVAKSLAFATESVCIPYVVDGDSIGQLTDRPEIAAQVGDAHGVPITRYLIDAPGRPVITFAPGRNFGTGPDGQPVRTYTSCSVTAVGAPSVDFEKRVYSRLREHLSHLTRNTKPLRQIQMPDGDPPPSLLVVCVLGPTPARISTSNPDWGSNDPAKEFFATSIRGLLDVTVSSHWDSEGCP
jgi:hypothetical protein